MAHLAASELFNVKGMVFVVTGGGTGIGSMMAKSLDANGASKVYILGRRLDKLEEVASVAINKSVVPMQCDITSQSDIGRTAELIKAQTPFVNVVIANHGIMGPVLDGLPTDRTPTIDEMYQYLWKTPMAEFNDTFNVNTTAVFYLFVAFMPLLDAGNTHPASPTVALGIDSQFIATSSIGAFSRVPKAGFAYSGSKLAVTHIVKQIATNMAPYHIRANVIAPGIYPSVMSDFFLGQQGKTLPPTIVPLQRAGTEEDIAGVTLFLCSRAGAYINGNVVITDGGRLSVVPATY